MIHIWCTARENGYPPSELLMGQKLHAKLCKSINKKVPLLGSFGRRQNNTEESKIKVWIVDLQSNSSDSSSIIWGTHSPRLLSKQQMAIVADRRWSHTTHSFNATVPPNCYSHLMVKKNNLNTSMKEESPQWYLCTMINKILHSNGAQVLKDTCSSNGERT